MSADQITPERIAELAVLIADEAEVNGDVRWSVARELLDALTAYRAEVQRLTDEARRSDAGRVEVPELTPDTLRDLIQWTERLRVRMVPTTEAINAWFRSRFSPSPQPATEPEKPYWWCPHCREEVDGRRVTFQELHDTCGYRVECRTSPQPSADVVVVPREEWECIQRIVKAGRNWLTDSKDNAVEDLSFELTQLNWIRNPADALRSSTNHDSKET